MPLRVYLDWYQDARISYRIITPFSIDAPTIDPSRPTILWRYPMFMGPWFFESQLDRSSDLAKYNHVIMDLFGHNDGSCGPIPTTSTAPTEVFLKIFETLGIDKAHLISVGASNAITLNFAVNNPERVASVQIMSLLPSSHFSNEESSMVVAGLKDVIEAFRVAALTDSGITTKEEMEAGMALFQLSLNSSTPSAPQSRMWQLSRQWGIGVAKKWGTENRHRTLLGILNYSLIFDYTSVQLKCPFQIIQGEKDACMNTEVFDRIVDAMRQNMPQLKVAVLPGGPHLVSLASPSEVNRILLSNLPPAPPLPTQGDIDSSLPFENEKENEAIAWAPRDREFDEDEPPALMGDIEVKVEVVKTED